VRGVPLVHQVSSSGEGGCGGPRGGADKSYQQTEDMPHETWAQHHARAMSSGPQERHSTVILMAATEFKTANKTVMQVLAQAIDGSEYDSLTFEIGKAGLGVAGTNKASNTMFTLHVPHEESTSFASGESQAIAVLAEPLEKFMGGASGAHVEEKATLSISIGARSMEARFQIEGILRRHRTVREFPYGKTPTTAALDPSSWPSATLSDPSWLTMASTSFERGTESEKVLVQVSPGKLRLHRSDDDVLELHAETKGTASSTVFHRIFQTLSKLCQISDVKPLRVSVKQSGVVVFELHFGEGGTLSYFVTPVIEDD